jgi:hypothetical protein
MNRKEWARIHTHIHTLHSDGDNSLLEMAKAHGDRGFDAFYVTDHNTTSAMTEAVAVKDKTGVTILPGVEYTTFYGHILSYGGFLADWTELSPMTLTVFLDKIKGEGEVSGIAHYHCLGYPVCTGCRFEFDGSGTDHDKLTGFDTMEVWHGDRESWDANHHLWTELLNRGQQITALAGLDAHTIEEVKNSCFANLVKIDPALPLEESIPVGLKKGALVLSRRELLDFNVQVDDISCSMGDIYKGRKAPGEGRITINCQVAPGNPTEDTGGKCSFMVVTNRGRAKVCSFSWEETDSQGEFSWTGTMGALTGSGDKLLWLHVELSREDYFSREIRAITNSVYFA